MFKWKVRGQYKRGIEGVEVVKQISLTGESLVLSRLCSQTCKENRLFVIVNI